jgi:hypothetical protein
MTAICEKLPIELANIVYSYLGEHPVATIIRECDENQNEFCDWCEQYTAVKDTFQRNIYVCHKTKKGFCEYCYGHLYLGVEHHTCVECGEKSYEWTDFNNTEEDGLFCGDCYQDYLDNQEEEIEEVELD